MRNRKFSSSRRRAVVLLSGGLDSATTLYFAKTSGYKINCLIFDYNQRHKREINSAKAIAQKAGCKYHIIKISFPWKGSALLDKSIKIPRRISLSKPAIPVTYVPARNTVFLSFALSFAEGISARTIFIGANAVDFSGYPDCRPDYIREFNLLAKLATKAGRLNRPIKILAPLIRKTKVQIIKLGTRLRVPYELTWSCYKGEKFPCRVCDSCRFRAEGFRQAGIKDPLIGI